MKKSILLVSEDANLAYTRTLLLSEWNTVALPASQAYTALRDRPYDLLILCQTVPDGVADELAGVALQAFATIQLLAIKRFGQRRKLSLVEHTVDLPNPASLIDAVARLLCDAATHANTHNAAVAGASAQNSQAPCSGGQMGMS